MAQTIGMWVPGQHVARYISRQLPLAAIAVSSREREIDFGQVATMIAIARTNRQRHEVPRMNFDAV